MLLCLFLINVLSLRDERQRSHVSTNICSLRDFVPAKIARMHTCHVKRNAVNKGRFTIETGRTLKYR